MKKIISIGILCIMLLMSIIVITGNAGATDIIVDPGDSIQAAVDSASAGDTVIVNSGEYHQSVVFGSEDSGITLRGESGAILDGDGPADSGTTLGVDAIKLLAGANNIIIEGFEIRDYSGPGVGEGNGIQAWNDGTSDIIVRNNEIHDNSWDAVLVGNEGQGLHTNWVIQDNNVYGNIAYNLELTNIKDGLMSGNTVVGGVVGLLIQARDTVPGDLENNGLITSSGIVIENNEVSETYYGIYLIAYAGTPLDPFEPIPGTYSSMEDVKVSGNVIHDNVYYGIYMWGIGGYSIQNTVLKDNDVYENGGDGIVLNNVENSNVFNNKVSNNLRHGIRLFDSDYNNIHHNNVNHNDADGIVVVGSDYNNVHHNKLNENGEYGIGVFSSSGNEIHQNTATLSGTANYYPDLDASNNWHHNY